MNIQQKTSAHHFRMQSEREQTLVPVGCSGVFSVNKSYPIGLPLVCIACPLVSLWWIS